MQHQYPEIHFQFLTSILLAVILIGTTVLIILLYQKRKNKQKQIVEDLKIQYEKELIQTQLGIQEQLLTDISMELHDNIGQIMLLAKVNMTLLQNKLHEPELLNLARDTKKHISQALNDITEISRSMHTDRIQQIEVFTLLHNEFESLSKKGLFNFVYIADYNVAIESKLSRDKQLTIYRTIQEVLKNILKHAEATEIKLIIKEFNKTINISVIDNGIGFNNDKNNTSNEQSAPTGIGIVSMKRRLEWIKGTFEIGKHMPVGTLVSLTIPFDE